MQPDSNASSTASSITDTIQRALNAAGLTRSASGRGGDIRKVIDRALSAAGLAPNKTAPPADAPAAPAAPGAFVWRTHRSAHGTRDYRLYVPSTYDGRAVPLIVMLHGCKQDPDDFAAGTRMNDHAERVGFLVAYPAQTARANGANCWNWFEPAHQQRDGAEPALLAGIVGDIGAAYAVQPGRVFVAGLSAGAAMAVILGATHPELFAGVAAHSGLPWGAANSVASAFAAMQGSAEPSPARLRMPPVRTIVFHGDADATVAVGNGGAIARQAVDAFERRGERLGKLMRLGVESAGRKSSMTEFTDEAGRAVVEEWVVHGAAHAWSGGSPNGSFTDARGPDASQEIVRFFLDDA